MRITLLNSSNIELTAWDSTLPDAAKVRRDANFQGAG
jgi:hypothetical protein